MAQHDLDSQASPTATTALTATLPSVPLAATAASEVFGIPELLSMIIGHVIVLEEAMADATDAALEEPDNRLLNGVDWVPYYAVSGNPADRSPRPRWLSVYDADNPIDTFFELWPFHQSKSDDQFSRCYCPNHAAQVRRVRRQYGFDLLRLRQVTQTFCATFDADPAVQRALGRRLSDSPSTVACGRPLTAELPGCANVPATVPRRAPILDTLALGCPLDRPFLPIGDDDSRLCIKVYYNQDAHTRVVVERHRPYRKDIKTAPLFNEHGPWRKILIHTDATAPDIQLLYYPQPPARKRKPYAPANLIPLASFSARDGHTLGGIFNGLELLLPQLGAVQDAIHSNTARADVERQIEQLQTFSHRHANWHQ